MALSVKEIFNIVGISDYQTILWNNIKSGPIPNSQGIYVIAFKNYPDDKGNIRAA